MPTCKTCSPKIKPEEACVLAVYRTRVGGTEMVFCCENSAKEYLKRNRGRKTAKTIQSKTTKKKQKKK